MNSFAKPSANAVASNAMRPGLAKCGSSSREPLTVNKPGLARSEPERHRLTVVSVNWFRDWCFHRGISVRDLQALLKLRSIATAEKKLNGESVLTLVDIACFPERFRHELTSMWLCECDKAHKSQVA